MKTIRQQMTALRKKESRSEKMAQQFKQLQTEINKGWNEIQQRIKDGETTGDQLKDFVITRYLMPSEEIEQRFRALQDRFKGHQGQYVMVVQRKQERICFRGPGQDRDSDYIEKDELNIGVLADDALIIDPRKGSFFFPTGGKHATCNRPYSENPVTIHDGNLTIYLFEDMGLKASPDLQILVGDKEVTEWFSQRDEREGYLPVFCELHRLRGRSLESPNT